MKVLNLRCAHAHVFEGWFGSEADFQSQHERGLVSCPLCADQTITRLPTAPRLNLRREHLSQERQNEVRAPELQASSETPPAVAAEVSALHARWLEMAQHVLAKTDDVGEQFPEEARRMHYGESPERAIRGQASAEEAQALRDEGIDVMAFPLPAAPKGTLQ